MTTDRIYLDHNATSPLRRSVLEVMRPFIEGSQANPSGVHVEARQARAAVDRARAQVANFLGALPDEIVFTSGGTESNNLAVLGAVEGHPAGEIIVSALEHQSVLDPCRRLMKQGHRVRLLLSDRIGRVRHRVLPGLISPQTRLVSVMAANNEVGTLQPVEEIASVAREHGVLMHTDAVQAAGKVHLDVVRLGVDLLTLSAHKLGGPQGVGALYIRRGVSLEPRSLGGPHERNRRAGTENVAGIVGFGAACAMVLDTQVQDVRRLERLRRRLYEGIRAQCAGVSLNGDPRHHLANTLSLRFDGVDAAALEIDLDLSGVAVSRGSACSAGSEEGSHVLKAMGLRPAQVRSAIRFSLGHDTALEEVDRAAAIVARMVDAQRTSGPGELVLLGANT
ncbi:MAG: cysteine desulfurase family protein [Pseudomonadota bacterium]